MPHNKFNEIRESFNVFVLLVLTFLQQCQRVPELHNSPVRLTKLRDGSVSFTKMAMHAHLLRSKPHCESREAFGESFPTANTGSERCS